jgi:serine/threonine protein kinase
VGTNPSPSPDTLSINVITPPRLPEPTPRHDCAVQPYTEYISTRWYRAPECLLTDGYYGAKMDIWGIGCVLFEVLALFPLFPGTDEADQIVRIHKITGTPPREVSQGVHGGLHVLSGVLVVMVVMVVGRARSPVTRPLCVSSQLLEKFRKMSRNANFSFPETRGTGFAHMLAHVSKEAVDLVTKLLIYDPDERWVAQAPRLLQWPACVCPVTGSSSSLCIESGVFLCGCVACGAWVSTCAG